MRLENKRIAMLAGPGFEDLEFWAVYMRMEEEGAQIDVVGTDAGVEYTGKSGGLTAETEVAAEEVDPAAVDAVLVPGGWTPDKIRRDQSVLNLVRDAYEDDKIIGLICHAGLVGISAGIVEGSDSTGSLGIKDDLENAGATWVDEPAFRDGNIVCGRVVKDIPDYNRVLVDALAEHPAYDSISVLLWASPRRREDPLRGLGLTKLDGPSTEILTTCGGFDFLQEDNDGTTAQ